MQANPFKLGDVLNHPRRFIVPVYQRHYAWEVTPQLETLFQQIQAKTQERLAGKETYPHYMGALLVIPRGSFSFGQLEVLDVVDGQQRLTTLQIFLAAARDLARDLGQATIGDLITPLLANVVTPLMKEPRVERYKLHSTAYDRPVYHDLLDLSHEELLLKYSSSYDKGKLTAAAPLPLTAWMFFRSVAEAFVIDEGLEQMPARLQALVATVLESFHVIVITLDERDDAQVIFETLNSGGKPLAAMDLVRNDIFHRATRSGEDLETLMESRWSTFDDAFWKYESVRGRIKKPRIDFFLSDVLAAETGEEILLTELYPHYKKFVKNSKFGSVDDELKTLLKYAPTFRKLVQPEGEGPLAKVARELEVFDVSTAYPLVYVIATSAATESTQAELYRLIGSYLARRLLCGLTTRAYNKTFLRAAAYLKQHEVSRESFVAALGSTEETAKFPDDAELTQSILTRKQYGYVAPRRLCYILGECELAMRDKFDEAAGLLDGLTIEHVMPDQWTTHWPLADFTKVPDDLRTGLNEVQLAAVVERETLKHVLGNLTLLTPAKNPSIGNLPFISPQPTIDDKPPSCKRDALHHSLLKMNQVISSEASWTEQSIRNRGQLMAEIIIRRWPPLKT